MTPLNIRIGIEKIDHKQQDTIYNDFINISDSDLEYCHPVSKEVYKMLTLPVFATPITSFWLHSMNTKLLFLYLVR